MTRDDIIRMAREVGLSKVEDCCGVPNKFCFNDKWKGNLAVFATRIAAAAAAAENEECAKVCEGLGRGHGSAIAEFDCAIAIRERGKP